MAETVPDDHEPVIGRYVKLRSGGRSYRIFYEEAGAGRPLICLHTDRKSVV